MRNTETYNTLQKPEILFPTMKPTDVPAKAKATEILTKATDDAKAVSDEVEERAASLRQAANEYCADALRRTEDAVAEAYSEIKESHDHFRALVTSGSSSASSARRAAPYDAEKDQ